MVREYLRTTRKRHIFAAKVSTIKVKRLYQTQATQSVENTENIHSLFLFNINT